jgi:class 3 adenylate cyclase
MKMKAHQILPTAPIVSMAAQALGIVPAHGLLIQLALFALALLALKAAKGYSFTFALQTLSGVASQRQIEALKEHVPHPVRRQIEKGNFDFDEQKTLENACVGFVDMVASAQISNRVSLAHGFQIKQSLFRAAAARAGQYNILILNHTGDGFLFLANHDRSTGWQSRLVEFYLALTSDFKVIIHQFNARTGHHIDSGLRFGISSGRVILGCLGSNPAHYTAVGADVNLAARLCAVAESNEMVFSESAWFPMRAACAGSPKSFQSHDLKGFEIKMAGIHFNRNAIIAHQEAA